MASRIARRRREHIPGRANALLSTTRCPFEVSPGCSAGTLPIGTRGGERRAWYPTRVRHLKPARPRQRSSLPEPRCDSQSRRAQLQSPDRRLRSTSASCKVLDDSACYGPVQPSLMETSGSTGIIHNVRVIEFLPRCGQVAGLPEVARGFERARKRERDSMIDETNSAVSRFVTPGTR